MNTVIGHTPGPWAYEYENADYSGGGCWYAIKGPDGGDLLWYPYNGPRSGGEREEANARLMAAAPELLEELQRARRVLVAEGYIPAATMDAAIAKATGASA